MLLPEFVCRDLLSSLAAVGARAVYYPVDEALNPASAPEKWPKAKAVVAVDYFGFPQDMAPFRAYAKKTGAVLIEDDAHGLFSRDENAHLLGLRGDLGILSLRKSLALPNGAALLSPRGSRFSLPPQEPFDAPDSMRYLGKQAYRVLAQALGAGAAYRGLSWLRQARRAVTGRRIPAASRDAELRLPLPDLPCGQLTQPLRVGDPQAEVERRRELFRLLAQRLEGVVEPIFKTLPEGVCPYGYPFRAQGAALSEARAVLASLGLEPLPWPDLPDELAASAPERYRNVFLAHFLW